MVRLILLVYLSISILSPKGAWFQRTDNNRKRNIHGNPRQRSDLLEFEKIKNTKTLPESNSRQFTIKDFARKDSSARKTAAPKSIKGPTQPKYDRKEINGGFKSIYQTHKHKLSTAIVFVFIATNTSCWPQLPTYVRSTLLHAQKQHSHIGDIVFASNFNECGNITRLVQGLNGVKLYDAPGNYSTRTKVLLDNVENIYPSGFMTNLWIHATTRFLIIEDVMRVHGYDQVIHAELDNLLYGNLSDLIPFLVSNYKSLAITPLDARLSQVTASFMWVANNLALIRFNDFLLRIICSDDRSTYQMYMKWLRKFNCCKKGGLDPDRTGRGVPPHAVNEMSMLAYYHFLYPFDLMYFPVIPVYDYLVRTEYYRLLNKRCYRSLYMSILLYMSICLLCDHVRLHPYPIISRFNFAEMSLLF